MARILYGVMGDALGHVSRSLAVAQAMPGHEFLFVGGGRAQLLKDEGYQLEDVPMVETFYSGSRVDFSRTITNFFKVFLGKKRTIQRVADIIKSFDPHLILTDYELFTPLAARSLGRPSVSLDHQHVLTHCSYSPPKGNRLNRLFTCFSVRHFFSASDRFLISSFFYVEPKDPERIEVLPPVVRSSVRNYQASDGEHILVYVKANILARLLPLLETRKSRVVVYGMGEKPDKNNLAFRRNSTEGFLEDMASCKYVITTAGHNIISEALCFGKPILCFPISFAYEQLVNAHFLAQLGYGEFYEKASIDAEALDGFESRLMQYRGRIRREDFFGNHRVAGRVEQLVRDGC
ncbi:MAG: hypothetical protein HY913_14065 [Desulfomonile tiedjei]|nr:hypothetical protein [Desulfomonile tiedjei]